MKKRRYVFLLGSLKKGGAERNLAMVASALCAEGHQIHLILFDGKVDYKIHENIHLKVLGIPANGVNLLKRLTIYIKVVIHVWRILPHYAVGFSRVSSQILAATFYPKIVCRFDSYPFALKRSRWVSMLIVFNLPNVRRVICPSSELRDDVKKYFLSKRKLRVIHNPVAEHSGSLVPSGNESLHHHRPYLIVMGRLTAQKHVDQLIIAYAESEAAKNYDLVILGEGNRSASLKALTKTLQLEDKVHFKGFIFNPYAIVQNAFLLLSASSKEGFPNVLVEALSMGVPVISSDCKTGPREIITHGVNGFLFPVGDVEKLRELINILVVDHDLYVKLKEGTRKSVEKFSTRIISDHWKSTLS